MFDAGKFINVSQVGGIDRYQISDGPSRSMLVLCVNTGAGLRYRVLIDRGFDIDQAFFLQHSLAFLSHGGVTPATRALDRDEDWHKGWPAGLLSSCGPMNIGPPGEDAGERIGRHGTHSLTAGTIESIVQPDVRAGRLDMSITGTVLYGAFYGPCVELRRTIRSRLGENFIEFHDDFINVGNTDVPHAWLLHINFGYPLVDAGAELCFDSPRIEQMPFPESQRRFTAGTDYKIIPPLLEEHRGSTCAVAYLFPKSDEQGNACVGIVNRNLKLGVQVRYSTREFIRCGNWQHFGAGEYVTALEPMNGTVNGRASDRANGLLDRLKPGERRQYHYRLDALNEESQLQKLLSLNHR